MDVQQQASSIQITRSKKKRWLRQFTVVIIIILALAITTAWIFSSLGIIPAVWATIISIIVTVIGVVFTILSVIIANDKSESPVDPPAYPPANKDSQQGIEAILPLTAPQAIQQREQIVKDIFHKLIQPDITAIVLTGIGGAGKSTLAALVYRYIEEQQLAGIGPFTLPPLWLRIDPAMTLADIYENLCNAFKLPVPDLSAYSSYNLAAALFTLLNKEGKGRLVVLDQFENLLDNDGSALPDRPGVGEWLDALNNQPCDCRILLTSRPRPKGTYDSSPVYLQIYHVPDLAEDEGVELLGKRHIRAAETELRIAVERCNGHPLSLTLLASLLREHNLSLAALLKDPQYTQFWTEDIEEKLLDAIFNQRLDLLQRNLLIGFSVYREPVPLNAAVAIMDKSIKISSTQEWSAINALLAQYLVHAVGEGCYQSHAIVAAYARAHVVTGNSDNKQANEQALLAAHTRAALYYRQRALLTGPSKEKRRKVSDVHDLLEALWQYCQARQQQEAYNLMEQEGIYSDLKKWGSNAILLELYQMLLPPDEWNLQPSQVAHIYNDVGWVYSDLGQKKKAQQCYELALNLYKGVGDRWGEGTALHNLGLIDNILGKKDKALQSYKQALEIYNEVGNRRGVGRILNDIGRLYADLGQADLMMKCYEQALSIVRQEKDAAWEARTLHNLGMASYSQGREADALTYFQEALRIHQESGDRGEEGKVLNGLGMFYKLSRDYDKALSYFQQALQIHTEIGNRLWQGVILNNIGLLYIANEQNSADKQKQKNTALHYIGKALSINREVGNRGDEAITLSNAGKIYFDQSRYDVALAFYLLARNILEEIRTPDYSSVVSWIHLIQVKIGEKQFIALLAQVEPQAYQIVTQALNEI